MTEDEIIQRLFDNNPDKVEQAKNKPSLVGWFVGQAMKSLKGKANPEIINQKIINKLSA